MHEILISEGNDLLTKLKEASSQVDWDKDAAYDKLLEILKGVNQLIDMAEKNKFTLLFLFSTRKILKRIYLYIKKRKSTYTSLDTNGSTISCLF